MRPVKYVEQMLAIDFSVNLCGGQAGVTQQVLNGPQIRPVTQQMCGKGMSQRMRCRRFWKAQRTSQFGNRQLNLS